MSDPEVAKTILENRERMALIKQRIEAWQDELVSSEMGGDYSAKLDGHAGLEEMLMHATWMHARIESQRTALIAWLDELTNSFEAGVRAGDIVSSQMRTLVNQLKEAP